MTTKARGRRLEASKWFRARVLLSQGVSGVDTAKTVGCSQSMASKLTVRFRRKPPRVAGTLRLSYQEREEVSRGMLARESFASVARRLGRVTSTISRDVGANDGRRGYRAWLAEERAERLCRRARSRKLETNPRLARAVEEMLARNWSPEQISRQLRADHPNDSSMQVSHETIYKALYIQGRGVFRKELARHLRTGRTERRTRGRAELRGKIRDLVEISQRPAEADDRAVPGHWEGDLILGKASASAIGTLVERTTRFVMLLHLPRGKTAEDVRQAMTKKIVKLPKHLRRSLTWDRGTEMSQHAQFTVDTGVRVFFCDPHSPWQRGSNENTNGLLRQYFPKGVDLNQYDAAHLDHVAAELNGRPRQTLGWRTPSQVLNELLR
jgi:transposase, IS30 family